MTDVTVLIPYTPEHDWHMSIAVASVERQTVPTDFVAFEDTEHRGAGWARNRLITGIETEFILFLDADDWLEPDAVEQMRHAIRPGHYVYSDWYVDGIRQHAPERPWCQAGTWHCITSLCYIDDVLRVGGFDERLPALEDTDFWLKMNHDGICGIHLPKPLFHYTGNGTRSQSVRKDGREQQIKQVLMQRYGGLKMGCCGQATLDMTTPQGQKQDGDVLAMALWAGNHPKRGRATGRRYPRMSYPKVAWVSPHDVQADTRNWRFVKNGKEEVRESQFVGVGGFAEAMIEAGVITPPPPPPKPGELPANYKLLNEEVVKAVYEPELQPIKPDFDKLMALGEALYE
jgi:hypothetical protein